MSMTISDTQSLSPQSSRRSPSSDSGGDGFLTALWIAAVTVGVVGAGARIAAKLTEGEVLEARYTQLSQSVEQRVGELEAELAAVTARNARLEEMQERLWLLAGVDPVEGEVGEDWGVPLTDDPAEWSETDGADEDSAALADLSPSARSRIGVLRTSLSRAQRDGDRLYRRLAELEQVLEERREGFERVPSILPTDGWISAAFGRRVDPFTGRRAFHRGLDVANRAGAPVVATAAGKVVFSGRNGSYGNQVRIDHGNGLVTSYSHNLKNLVKRGDTVARGDTIALVGSTGRSTSSHVHYEVLAGDRRVNPWQFLVPDDTVVD